MNNENKKKLRAQAKRDRNYLKKLATYEPKKIALNERQRKKIRKHLLRMQSMWSHSSRLNFKEIQALADEELVRQVVHMHEPLWLKFTQKPEEATECSQCSKEVGKLEIQKARENKADIICFDCKLGEGWWKDGAFRQR